MLKKYFFLSLFILLFQQTEFAMAETPSLERERVEVVKQYIKNLGNADYKAMANLFEKEGMVVAPDGYANAKEFYYNFFPTIQSSSTLYKDIFPASIGSKNILAARFRFKARLKSGKIIDAESVDQYIFSPNSKKLAAVYMFENVNFPERF